MYSYKSFTYKYRNFSEAKFSNPIKIFFLYKTNREHLFLEHHIISKNHPKLNSAILSVKCIS